MISLTFLYEEYLDRPKMAEKNSFEYIGLPPHHKWGRNKQSGHLDYQIANLRQT